MKRSAVKKKRRSQQPASGPKRQVEQAYEPIALSQKETVVEILRAGETAARALEVGLSAFIRADHFLARFDCEADLPKPIACTPGCDHCCYNQVELTPPEALVIGDFVDRHFSREEREGLQAQLALSLAVKSGKNKRQIAALRRQLPCPLWREHRCSAYTVRPLVCRSMHSLDAGQCERALMAGDLTSAPYYLERHELVRAISRGLLAGGLALGCQSAPLDLAVALEDYFRQPDPLGQWLRGERVFSL